MDAVIASAEGRSHPSLGSNRSEQNGETMSNGTREGKANGTKKGDSTRENKDKRPYDPARYIEEADVRIPETVVDEGVRGLKDILREMVDMEEDNAPNGDKK